MNNFDAHTPLEILERLYPGFFNALSESWIQIAESLQSRAYQTPPACLVIQNLADALNTNVGHLLNRLEESYRDWLSLETPAEEAFLELASGRQNCLVVDLREAWEYEFERIHGAWPLHPFDIDALKQRALAAQKVLLYCHHGVRSRYVAAYLREFGLNHVTSIKGGLNALALHYNPPLRRY